MKYNEPYVKEDLKGCTLYKSKPLEYHKQKGAIYKRGLFTGD